MHGLTGPIDGTTYTDVMVPMGSNNDDWIAAIALYVRNSFGNTAIDDHPGRRRERSGRRPAIARRRGPLTKSKRRCPCCSRRSRRGRRPRATTPRPPRMRSAPARGRPANRSRPACGFRSSCPRPRRSPRSSSRLPPGGRRGAARRGGPGRGRRSHGAGARSPTRSRCRWTAARGARLSPKGRVPAGRTVIRVRAGRGEVRPHHADRSRPPSASAWTLQRLRLYQAPKRTP